MRKTMKLSRNKKKTKEFVLNINYRPGINIIPKNI